MTLELRCTMTEGLVNKNYWGVLLIAIVYPNSKKKNFAPKWTLMQYDKGVGDEVMKAMTKTQHAT